MQRGTAAPIVLVTLLIVGLIGVLSYLFKPSFLTSAKLSTAKVLSSDTKLLTYTNQNLGFEFQYSNSVSVKEDSEEDFNQRAAGSASKSGNGTFRKNFTGYVGYAPGEFVGAVVALTDQSIDLAPLSIWVFENPDNLDGSAWFEKYWYYPFLWGVFFERDKGHVRAENIATISGQTTKYADVFYQPGSPKYLYLSNRGKMYLIRIIGEAGDKILSTFKFLPASPAGGDQNSAEGKFCGGIAGNLPENQCPKGYRCQLDGDYPDAGGKCVKSQ